VELHSVNKAYFWRFSNATFTPTVRQNIRQTYAKLTPNAFGVEVAFVCRSYAVNLVDFTP
jgi:uncharacterized protein YhbP (UPF0306 family)